MSHVWDHVNPTGKRICKKCGITAFVVDGKFFPATSNKHSLNKLKMISDHDDVLLGVYPDCESYVIDEVHSS